MLTEIGMCIEKYLPLQTVELTDSLKRRGRMSLLPG